MKLGWRDSEAVGWGWSFPELPCEKPMTFLTWIYFLPTTFSALLWKYHHLSNPWYTFFSESRLTENDWITFLVLLLFWATVLLLPSYDCKVAGTTTRMLHLIIFLFISRKPWFLLLEVPLHDKACIMHALSPQSWNTALTSYGSAMMIIRFSCC